MTHIDCMALLSACHACCSASTPNSTEPFQSPVHAMAYMNVHRAAATEWRPFQARHPTGDASHRAAGMSTTLPARSHARRQIGPDFAEIGAKRHYRAAVTQCILLPPIALPTQSQGKGVSPVQEDADAGLARQEPGRPLSAGEHMMTGSSV
jgi:hypothetical protein